jgi:hypothetical protein
MFLKIYLGAFLALTIGFIDPAFADPGAKIRKGPHGGVLQEAAGMHAEFSLDKSGQPRLHLYDQTMKPLNPGELPARLTIKGHGGVEHTRDLKLSKDAKEGPLFTGERITGLSDWDTAVVSVKLKDGWKHIRFSHH